MGISNIGRLIAVVSVTASLVLLLEVVVLQAKNKDLLAKVTASESIISQQKAAMAVLKGEIDALHLTYAFRQKEALKIEVEGNVRKEAIAKTISQEKAAADWGNTPIPNSIMLLLIP